MSAIARRAKAEAIPINVRFTTLMGFEGLNPSYGLRAITRETMMKAAGPCGLAP